MSLENSVYDEKNKIWTYRHYSHEKFIRQSIGEAFLKSINSIDGDKPLEYYYDTNTSKSAREIHQEAVTVAVNLKRIGFKRGDVVVLYMQNNPLAASLAMGCYLNGCIVNYFETKLMPDHIDHIIEMIQPPLILYESEYSSALNASLERLQLASNILCLELNPKAGKKSVHSTLYQAVAKDVIENYKPTRIEDPAKDICSLLMTSGSTGAPKLVQISHSLLLHGIATWWPEIQKSDAVLFSFSPLRWISQVAMMMQSLLFGVKRVCVKHGPSGPYGADIIRTSKITHMFSAPGIYRDILMALPEDDCSSLASMRLLALGGEPASEAVMQLARKKSPHSKVVSCYGMTEASGVICQDEVLNGGFLAEGIEMKILDDHMQPLGPQQPGQMAFRTIIPLAGYLRVDRSKDFLADGFLVNGDYGYFDEQRRLVVLARYKDLIKANGVTLIPDAIESLVRNKVDKVSVAYVVGYRADSSAANEIGALFVISPVGDHSEALRHQIRSTLAENLPPSEAAIIRDIHFIEAMPLTTCGKLDRVALRALAKQYGTK